MLRGLNNLLIAKFLRTEGRRAEPHTLEHLVNHMSERSLMRQYLVNKESSTIHLATSLISGNQGKLSADQYHFTISRAQGWSLSRSRVFFKLIAEQKLFFPLDRWLKQGYLSGGEGGSTCKGKISGQINLWNAVDFFHHIPCTVVSAVC